MEGGAFRVFALSLYLVLSWGAHATRAYSLAGKRVLVTGASGGIGKGIALELGRQGCEVLIHYHVREKGAAETRDEILASGGSCAGITQCDFRQSSNIHDLFRYVDQLWPEGFDILVNNAGIVTKLALEDDDDEGLVAWHETMAVNLHAPRLLSHLALHRMKQRDEGGVILMVSSIHSEKSNEYVGAYAVSKAGWDALTRAMALEYAQHNVRVNSINPGVVPVERTAEAFADPSNVQAWADRIPLGKLGTVEHVAQACLPLLTNDWITGAIWQVDGGMMARSNMPTRPRPLKFGGIC
ncbi:predicted protein [Phaeodactylum tricornutum CCAP 1055/1]|jgi:glucose 1-dehydrogenase|uniref:Uncharacterized protein n=1 Tax=Phaeodactylum tricornutum (strain CCAP 1055/1) TaxID=556484 RepID=B7G461_PHATC|nr:predicted protein [Phaeodactylum tricornutum CCAP 1055/1]EEC46399.1 predicted protein [Phaeodactylum tricornutum CCAP 1055/1]|eukprot:XP_002181859.1 predicted protein [Phaeodactylum tricornutum CCAP 1055/1]